MFSYLVFNILVKVEIVLIDLSNNTRLDSSACDVVDRNHFNYVDKDGLYCKVDIYETGICLFRKGDNYSLNLDLNEGRFAEISTAEGVLKLNAKVVDFSENNDILVMRYIIEGNEREIRIIYRS